MSDVMSIFNKAKELARNAPPPLDVGPAYSDESGLVVIPSKGTLNPVAIMSQAAYLDLKDSSDLFGALLGFRPADNGPGV